MVSVRRQLGRTETAMARYTGPKFKLSRREGINLTGTTSPRLEQVINIPPGGRKAARRRQSDYGLRLRAKQRVKGQYGMKERQFRKFFKRAQRMQGPTGFNLLQLLERRLDNAVYRLGFARTRPMARQMVSHGHVQVNGRNVNVPAYLLEPGEVVELRESALEMPVVQEELTTRGVTASWLDRQDRKAVVTGLPRREDIEPDIREDLIVEFYAR
jgi:small subunit ribosomal protein S4